VLSRRVLLEKERDALKARTLENLEEGMVVTGVIKNITEYGAFVDLGGIDGLLHITDMSWGRVNHPSEVFNVGDEGHRQGPQVQRRDRARLLGLKQTMEDPWNHASESYPQGKRVRGKVVSITDYGAFVEMEQGIEGPDPRQRDVVEEAQAPVKVWRSARRSSARCSTSTSPTSASASVLKQLEPDPWTQFTTQYNPGDIIRGKVRSVTDYGVFIGIEDGVDGMVHKSDLSWTQRINNPADVYRKGDEVEAIILSINHDEKKVSLGIKQLYEDPWTASPTSTPRAPCSRCASSRSPTSACSWSWSAASEGLIHISELSDSPVDDPSKVVKEGEIVKAEIIAIDSEERRIALSLKSAAQREETVEAMKYVAEQRGEGGAKATGPSGRAGATLGDLLKDKLAGIAPKEK
jgi:small subunit ribosomal protein S1